MSHLEDAVGDGEGAHCFGVIFYVSLTVHLSITLANDQFDAQIFNTFITILYMYMFLAISCSSSGGQIVLTFWHPSFTFKF
jgi:hypothetical protein